MTAFDDQLQEAYEVLDMMGASIGETEAEARNEVALFGDSWPGSAIQISESRAYYRSFEDHLDVMINKVQPMFEKFSRKGDHEGAGICLSFFKAKPDKLSKREAKAWEVFEAL